MSRLFYVAPIVVTLTGLAACSNEPIPSANVTAFSSNAIVDPGTTPPSTRAPQDKVSQHISALLEEIHTRGLTRESMTETEARLLSSQLVRINRFGQIQVYIDVAEVNKEVVMQLEEKEATIELSDASLRVVQAWIPFDRIRDVAAMKSVRHIKPPDYAIPRN